MLKEVLQRARLRGLERRLKKALCLYKAQMSHPPYGADTHRLVKAHIDIVRYGAIALALHRLNEEKCPARWPSSACSKAS